MNLGLEGRTAIVCGGSAGIGLAIARSLRAEGANVVIFSNEPENLDASAKEIEATAVAGDLRDPSDLRRLVECAVDTYGSIDVVVHNGGGPEDGRATELTDESVRAAVELLLVPVVHLTRLCIPHLERSAQGRIVAIVSTSVREPIDELALSNTVRPAVLGWVKTLAREVGPSGVTVNAVAPGRIHTRTFAEFYRHRSQEDDLLEIPVGRFGDPAEVGDLVCFLASSRAAYISGTVLSIDGGLTRSYL